MRHLRASIAFAAAAAHWPMGAIAQEASQGIPCVIDTAEYRRVLSVTVWLDAGVDPGNGSDRAVAARAFVASAQSEFRAPTIPFGTGRMALEPSSFIGSDLLTGKVTVDLTSSRETTYRWNAEPGWSALQASLDSAIMRAGKNSEFQDAVTGLPQKPYQFQLQVHADSEPPSGRGLTLVRLRIPYLAMTSVAQRIGGPYPEYPRGAAAAGKSGYVDIQYVIMENGRADPSSLRTLAISDGVFLAPARKVILETQYQPAMIAGCPVQQVVRQRVRFST